MIKNNNINDDKNNDDVDNKNFLSNDEKSNFTPKNTVKKNEIFPSVYNSYQSDIYYSYGIFFLKKGSLEGIQNAKKMFTLAISSTMIEENTKKSLTINIYFIINYKTFFRIFFYQSRADKYFKIEEYDQK